jgi:hypothetical protein
MRINAMIKKNSFHEELERVFDRFHKYHIILFLGDFNAKVGREDIFKSVNANESLHETSNDNLVKIVHSATSKNLIVKNTMFPHGKFMNILGLLLMEKHTVRLTSRRQQLIKYT